MEQIVLEKTRKSKFGNGNIEPSDRQKSYIVDLARDVGMKIDITKIDNRQKASKLIDNLEGLKRKGNVKQNGVSEVRDKRIAYGMATKLVFKKYTDRHKEIRKSKKFWQEVNDFYNEYLKQQGEAIYNNFTNGRLV